MDCHTESSKQRLNIHLDIIRKAGLPVECYEWIRAGLTVWVLDPGRIPEVQAELKARITKEGVELQVFVKGPGEK